MHIYFFFPHAGNQRHYKIDELFALLDSMGLALAGCIEVVPDPSSPYAFVYLPNDDAALELCSRSFIMKKIMRHWVSVEDKAAWVSAISLPYTQTHTASPAAVPASTSTSPPPPQPPLLLPSVCPPENKASSTFAGLQSYIHDTFALCASPKRFKLECHRYGKGKRFTKEEFEQRVDELIASLQVACVRGAGTEAGTDNNTNTNSTNTDNTNNTAAGIGAGAGAGIGDSVAAGAAGGAGAGIDGAGASPGAGAGAGSSPGAGAWRGVVDLADPEVVLCFWEGAPTHTYTAADTDTHTHTDTDTATVTTSPSDCNSSSGLHIGRLIFDNSRKASKLVDTFHLRKGRPFLGPTSMDCELSFIMSTLGNCRPGALVLDPFVGSASILVSATRLGATCVGCDIDMRILTGGGIDKSKGTVIADNFLHYGLPPPDILCASQNCRAWRRGGKRGGGGEGCFDAIITDPPYGVRAGARKIAPCASSSAPASTSTSTSTSTRSNAKDKHKKDTHKKDTHRDRDKGRDKGGHSAAGTTDDEQYAPTLNNNSKTTRRAASSVPYSTVEILDDLLDLAAEVLVLGGRLVCFVPSSIAPPSALSPSVSSVPSVPQAPLAAASVPQAASSLSLSDESDESGADPSQMQMTVAPNTNNTNITTPNINNSNINSNINTSPIDHSTASVASRYLSHPCLQLVSISEDSSSVGRGKSLLRRHLLVMRKVAAWPSPSPAPSPAPDNMMQSMLREAREKRNREDDRVCLRDVGASVYKDSRRKVKI
jgi:tRNA G10  N-methylase Trm11